MSEINSPAATDLSCDAERIAQEAATRIKARLTRAATDVFEIGRDLITVKKALGHGRFLPWIEAEFGMSEWTARNFMRVAETFKSGTVPDLPLKVLYALAMPSTPETVRAEAIERASRGEPVSLNFVHEMKREVKETRINSWPLECNEPVSTVTSADLGKTLEDARRQFRGKLASLSNELKDAVECILDRYPEEAPALSAMLMARLQELQAAGGKPYHSGQTKRLAVVH